MSRGISTVFVALSKLPGVWGTWYPLVHPVVSVAILNESIHSKATTTAGDMPPRCRQSVSDCAKI